MPIQSRALLALSILLTCPDISLAADKRPARIVNPANALEKVNDSTDITTLAAGAAGVRVIRAQILMDRARFSPGEIDGRFGPDLEIAVRGYREAHKLKPGAMIDTDMWALLNVDKADLLTEHIVNAFDLREQIAPIPKATAEQAKLTRMTYAAKDERAAEQFHLSPALLHQLNPGHTFDTVGEQWLVPHVRQNVVTGAAKVVVSKSKRTVTALSPQGRVLGQYPATIGGPHDPLPIGNWKITDIRPFPVFFYDPERFWNADQTKPKFKLPPGPNNPAGTVWLGLSKQNYGIHGGPEPGTVRRTESYGCIRLTNWDATDLSRMVRVGTPVILEE